MKKTIGLFVFFAGGCFSDASSDGGDTNTDMCRVDCGSSDSSDDAGVTTGGDGDSDCFTGCETSDFTNTGTETGVDTGTGTGTETETGTGTETGTDTGEPGTGTETGMDTTAAECELNNECGDLEVCSVGLGECIPAEAAVYQITISTVQIWGGPACGGDPDDGFGGACMQEIYIKAFVDNILVDQSGLHGVDYVDAQTYQFLANLSATLTIEIWDSDANEGDMVDDLLLRKMFSTPPAVLHMQWLSDTWMEGNVTKSLSLYLIAQ